VATRWRRWSRYWRPLLTVGGVATLGIVAEWQHRHFKGDSWFPDLAVGVGLAIAGAAMGTVDRRSRVGDLVVLAGVAWFIPDLVGIGGAALAWLAVHTIVLHRAVLFHAIVAFPTGRLVRRFEGVVVVLAYGASLSDLAREERGEIAWAIAAMVAFIAILALRTGPARDAGIRVLPTMALFCLVVGGTGVLLLIFGNAPPPPATIHAYEAGLVAVAFALLLNVYDHRARLARMTDAAVELTLGPAGYVRELLANALGDPSAEVAFAVHDGGSTGWVDELGRRIGPLRATGSRAVVPILVDGRAVAQLACESVVIDEPGLMPSIQAAARLAANNAQLRASLRAEAEAVEASRLRLLSAADDERIALADQLDRGAGASVVELRAIIERIPRGADPAIAAAAERSRGRIAGLDAGLRSLAAGLGPPTLRSDGLAAALSQLGVDARLEVHVDIELGDMPNRLASTLYFICAEAIANALKHASASTIDVHIREDGDRLWVEIVDDGSGGAVLEGGSGLQGLVDRTAALGGTLAIASPSGAGTRITADLPMASFDR
jgi:signal transduction histidine kinase